jgi:putative oxidoreductase
MMHGFMGKCSAWCHNKSIGQLLLRIALGSFFVAHGVSKFINMKDMVGVFSDWGLAQFWAYVVAVSEIVAGLTFLAGAFVWIGAALIVVEMAVAMWIVIIPNTTGQDALPRFIFGWGQNLIYAMAAVSLAFTGSGKWSLTGWWMRRNGASCINCKADHGMNGSCKECDVEHGKHGMPMTSKEA